MALLPAVAAFHVLAVLAVFYADRGGAPDEDIETVITRADNKAADSGGSELQVGGGDGKVGFRTKTFLLLFSSFLRVPKHDFVCLQESGVETHGKTLPDKIVVAGNPEGREVHLRLPGAWAALVAQRQAQRRGRNGSRGSGDNQPTEEGEVLRSSREEVINLSGHSHSSHVKICTLIMLASFVSGVSILLLNFLQCHISVSLQLFRSLKCTTFALLVLALLDVSFIFMKIIALLAFVPTIAVVVIACVVAFGEVPSTSEDHHQQ
ncbi:hypothetical protein B296_00053479 [Ensete ventricosum]|uniref:PGG domain-containing protein n=1 Tax=Ensete ventricosum TaxID=4639 RepID=A0A426XD35_ENSVE|nr:hypothetical protein B296_00053479 [Ensete ventricosum]